MFAHESMPPSLDPYGLYRRLLEMHAQGLRDVLVSRLIRRCQRQPIGLMGDTGLKNLWEEICIAIRTEHLLKDVYLSHLENHLNALIEELPALDQRTLWLMTYQGTEYATTPEKILGEEPDKPCPSLKPSEWPVHTRKVAVEIINEDILHECFNYDNARIRAYEGR